MISLLRNIDMDGSNKIINLGAATNPADAVRFDQLIWSNITGKPSVANQVWYGNGLQSANLTFDGTNFNLANNGAIQLNGQNSFKSAPTVQLGNNTIGWNVDGNKLAIDEEFSIGLNNVNPYNNNGGTALTLTRTNTAITNTPTPNSTGYYIKIQVDNSSLGTAPNWGGFFVLLPALQANRIYVQRFRALVPVGYTLNLAANSQGNNVQDYWLSNNQGTGKWEEYVRVVKSGDSGTFSTSFFVSVSGGATPTVATPLIWYIASSTVIEVTNPNQISSQTGYFPNLKDANNTVGTSGQLATSNGNSWSWQTPNFAAANAISGTANYSARFLTSSTLGVGAIYDNGTNVGLGTTNPITTLQVNKSVQTIGATTPSGGVVISDIAGSNLGLELGINTINSVSWIQSRNITSASYYKLALNPSGGNVLIGTVTDNSVDKLQVNGSASFTGLVNGIAATSANNFIIKSQLDALSGSYQPLENQRLSTTNAPTFNYVNSPVGYISSSNGTNGFQLRNISGSEGLTFSNYGNTIEWARISTNGNLMLGTTTDIGTKLQIIKNSTYNNESSAGIYLESGQGATNTGIQIGADKTNNVGYIQTVEPSTSYATKNLVLNPNGSNVLIGSIADNGNKLQVNGTGNFTGLVSGIAATSANNFVIKSQLDAVSSTAFQYRSAVITEATDWNTVTTTGTYQVTGNNVWGTGLNNPATNFPTAYAYGLLEVTTNNANTVTQRYTTAVGSTFVRSKFNASDWVAWFLTSSISGNVAQNYLLKYVNNGYSVQSSIYDNGNVGINNTSPTRKLDINGSVYIRQTMGGNDPSALQHNTQFEIRQATGEKSLAIGVLDNGTSIIQSKESGVGYNTLALNPVNGNVGIALNTLSPTSKLDVFGDLTIGISGSYAIKTRITGNIIKPLLATSGNNTFFYNADAGSILFRNSTDNATIASFNNDLTANFSGLVSGIAGTSANNFVIKSQLDAVSSGYAIPSNRVAYGNGTGLTSSSNLTFDGTSLSVIGTGSFTGTVAVGTPTSNDHAINLGVADGRYGRLTAINTWTALNTFNGNINLSNSRINNVGGLNTINPTSTNSRTFIHAYSIDAVPATGTLVIELPVAASSQMMQIEINGYQYSANQGAWKAIIGGYNYANGTGTVLTWYNYNAIIGGNPPFSTVRLGYNTTTGKAVILLGNTTTSWQYPKIFMNVYSGQNYVDLSTGWTHSFITTEGTNLTNIVTCNLTQNFIGDIKARDVYSNRGDNTGAIYFGDGSSYIYKDASNYNIIGGNINLGVSKIINLSNGTAPSDAVNLSQLNYAVATPMTGTVGYIPKWNTTTSFTNSLITDNGSAIGINQTTPLSNSLFSLKGVHANSRIDLYSTGDNLGGANDAFISIWASRPNISFGGGGIGYNVQHYSGGVVHVRKNTANNASFIDFKADGSIGFNLINTSDVQITPLVINNNGSIDLLSSISAANATAGNHLVNRNTGDTRYAQLAAANNFTASQTITTGLDQAFTINKTTGTNWNYQSFALGGTRQGYFGINSNADFVIGVDGTNKGMVLAPTGTGTINVSGARVINVGDATTNGDAVSRSFGDNRYWQFSNTPTFTQVTSNVLNLNGASGIASRTISYKTNNILRWDILAYGTESSGNVGSDLIFNRYDDAGTLVNTPFFLQRSTGNIGINTTSPTSGFALTVNGAALVTGNVTTNATLTAANVIATSASTNSSTGISNVWVVGGSNELQKAATSNLAVSGYSLLFSGYQSTLSGGTYTMNCGGYGLYTFQGKLLLDNANSYSYNITASNYVNGGQYVLRVFTDSPNNQSLVFDTMFKNSRGGSLGTIVITSTSKAIYRFHCEAGNLYLQD